LFHVENGFLCDRFVRLEERVLCAEPRWVRVGNPGGRATSDLESKQTVQLLSPLQYDSPEAAPYGDSGSRVGRGRESGCRDRRR
jgi:hypothetical protein